MCSNNNNKLFEWFNYIYTYLFLVMARAFGPQLACGFSGNLASLSDRDFGLAPGITLKSACILIKEKS